jgi:hypothetical protein
MISRSAQPAATTPGDYLHRDRCPCCGEKAQRSHLVVASEPPAETLAIADHGQFLSGYSASRVFFSYSQCESCGLRYCRTYYTQAQLERLYGRQAENMADVPLQTRQLTQAEYVHLVARHSRMDGGFLPVVQKWRRLATPTTPVPFASATLKVPTLFFLTLIVTFPSLYVFNALVGSRLDWGSMLRLLVASIAGIVAGCLEPSLLQRGPLRAFVSIGSVWPAGKFILMLALFLQRSGNTITNGSDLVGFHDATQRQDHQAIDSERGERLECVFGRGILSDSSACAEACTRVYEDDLTRWLAEHRQ